MAEDSEEASRTKRPTSAFEADARFMRSVLAASDDCIKVLSLDGDLVLMSEGGQRVMEISDFNDVKGCPWPDFWEGKATVKPERRSKPLAVAAAQDSKLGRTRRREMRDGGMCRSARYSTQTAIPWLESGGPPVLASPAKPGFGSRLIERVLAGYLGGIAKIDYLPGGVEFALQTPLAALVSD